jgi:hypothetical protein
VVLYPTGQKWSTAPTVMYANAIHPSVSEHLSLPAMVARDVAQFRKRAPAGRVTEAEPVRTRKGQVGTVRYFSNDGGPPHDAVAYFEEKNVVVLLCLAARDAGGFTRSLPAFREMAGSYQFVAGDISTPTH